MNTEQLQDLIDDAVYMAQRSSGRSGADIVYQALALVRTELVAAVGHRAAAALLHNLADAIEADSLRQSESSV